jgi:CRP-like cAMP-binding protein
MEIEAAIKKFRDFLKSSTEFDQEAFDMALPYFETRHLKKGELFIESDRMCRYFAFVVSGIMRAFNYEGGDETTTCLCNENAFASSTVSLITQTPSIDSVQALGDTDLLMISYAHLQELYKRSPFWQSVGRIIAEKEIMFFQNTSWRNSKMPAMEKYLTLLKENPGISNRIPLQYIASYLGIKPETLSRIRKKIATRIS